MKNNFDNNIESMIIDLFKNENHSITKDNIKILKNDTVAVVDVMVECNHIKELKSDILIYTKLIPSKSYIEKTENVKIFDLSDLKELCLKYDNQQLYKLL